MGKLFVVGVGPGDPAQMTEEARMALERADQREIPNWAAKHMEKLRARKAAAQKAE